MGDFRWLDLDIENRPISYLGQDFTTPDITAIAWSLGGTVECYVQSKHSGSQRKMLAAFRRAWDEADGATGHNLRRHDLPIINGALMELELEPLDAKLVCDTYGDFKKRSGISRSQENLAEMLGIESPKIGMSTPKWRKANRLTPDGVELTRLRVIGDVVQHQALRRELLARDLLHPPKVWRP